MRTHLLLAALISIPASLPAADEPVEAVRSQADLWRAQGRLIDLHQHIDFTKEHLTRAVNIMDAAGVGLAVNLSGGFVTHRPGEMSEFEKNKKITDELFPGRFLLYMNLDYSGWDQPDFAEKAGQQVEEGRGGAAGFKQFKSLGLYLRDGNHQLIKVDDPKLDLVWQRCGELQMPVSIHVADPAAFWLPYNDKNEHWKELRDHRSWWFGDPKIYPPRMETLDALTRVVARHPKTTFVSVHFANNSEDIDWVDRRLDEHPNLYADLAARIPEIGRHDPRKVHDLFVKHQDRILFATDFQVYDDLILGSSGNEPPRTDAAAATFFKKEYRWLETWDQNWQHMTPIQGDWTISSIGLPSLVLRKIYFDNARKLLARSMPAPVVRAARVRTDFEPDGNLAKPVWEAAAPARIDYQSLDSTARPEVSTAVRLAWSDQYLYLAYECPYTTLTVFNPPQFDHERRGLWDRDVVEAFIGPDFDHPRQYLEFEVAPTNEKLDLALNLPSGADGFDWDSRFQSAVRIDEKRKVWTSEWRIPLALLSPSKPAVGTRWRANFYRCDRFHHASLAWNPTLQGSFHAPQKFGFIEFAP